jgi:hypothetical protein
MARCSPSYRASLSLMGLTGVISTQALDCLGASAACDAPSSTCLNCGKDGVALDCTSPYETLLGGSSLALLARLSYSCGTSAFFSLASLLPGLAASTPGAGAGAGLVSHTMLFNVCPILTRFTLNDSSIRFGTQAHFSFFFNPGHLDL